MRLTADKLAALKAAKHGWQCNGCTQWFDVKAPEWTSNCIYRAKPAPVTHDVVPWEAIDARIVATARDDDGSAYGYQVGPEIGDEYWSYSEDGEEETHIRIDGVFAGYTPGTCDWRDSLQQRPQPAATGAVTDPLALGAPYWLAIPGEQDWADEYEWANDDLDRLWLSRGLVFLTEAAAVAHAKRMTGGV